MGAGIRSAVALLASVGILSAAAVWQAPPVADPTQPLAVLKAAAPRYWKGNLHTHSFWSDGDDFPEMIADWYQRHGYHFLGLSDHNVLSDGDRWLDVGPAGGPKEAALKKYLARFGAHWVERREQNGTAQVRLKPLREFRSTLEEPGRFLMIPAEEVTHRFAKLPVHINAINVRDLIQPLDGDTVAETVRVNLQAIAEQRKRTGWNILGSLNHPNFGWGVRAEDMAEVPELRFFEVYNGHPGVRNYGDDVHASCERMWDIVLALRLGRLRLPIVYGLGTDDAHHYHTFAVGKSNPGRGWVMVRAPYLSAESVVRSMEAGDFYVSSGVVLEDVTREGKELRLRIQGEEGVRYQTQFIATLRDTPLTSEPRLGPDKKPLEVTRQYHADVGKVVAESADRNPVYRFTGQEWYVRAKVISTKPHSNPFQKGDMETAWTQPFAP
ncbi:MAG: hypothetical protein JNM56_29870 [Planctomycetia bacterium]|nr:hypothetical protein [Planctomycetia bacterium]